MDFKNITNVTVQELGQKILTIIANNTRLEKDEISLEVVNLSIIIHGKGSEDQIKELEEFVIVDDAGNSALVDEIEKETGQKTEIEVIETNYNSSINTPDHSELKELIKGLIIAVSILTFVIIAIATICFYCLFTKKRNEKEKNTKNMLNTCKI